MTARIRRDRAPAQRRFAAMLRQLRNVAADLSQAEIARQVGVHHTTLSKYMSAAFLPTPQALSNLYKAAQSAAERSGGAAMPFSREQLDAAFQRAQAKLCRTCPVRDTSKADDPWSYAADEQGSEPDLPGVGSEPQTPGSWPAATSDPAMTHDEGPVPPSEGDRPPRSELEWVTANDIAQYLSEERAEDVRVILTHAGTTARVSEIPGIIDSCRAVGLDDAAETVLHHVGQRAGQEVLRIVGLFLSCERYIDAKTVVQSAAPS